MTDDISDELPYLAPKNIGYESEQERHQRAFNDLLRQSVPYVTTEAQFGFYHFFTRQLKDHPTTFPKAIAQANQIRHALQHLFDPKASFSQAMGKTLLSYLPPVSDSIPTHLFVLFHHSDFLDKVIEKKNTDLLRYALEHYRKHPGFLRAYLLSDRFGYTEKDNNLIRFSFFSLSPIFNDLALQLLPPKFFIENGIPLALSISAQIHNPTRTGLLSKQQTYFHQLSPEAERSFFKTLTLTLLSDPIPTRKIPDVLPLMEHAYHSPHTAYQAWFADFLYSNRFAHLKAKQPAIIDTLLAAKLTSNQHAILLHTLCSTSAGYDMALRATLSTKETPQKYLLWHTLDEGSVAYTDQHACQLIARALSQADENMIFGVKKKLPPADSPIFVALRDYFQDQPKQALRFLDTCTDISRNPITYWDDVVQFVQLPAARLKLFSHYHIIHQWAKMGEYGKIQDFFRAHNLSPKTREFFWRQKDDAGRTPWHFICAYHHKEFLKKMTPSMRRTFLEQLHTPDNSGKTLIDLMYANTKFMKFGLQLIPDLKQAFIDAGYRIDTVKFTEKTTPAALVPEPVSTPAATSTTPWQIDYRGHDNERKNPDFIRLIEAEVGTFPPPCSSALRERQNREMKRQTYTVAAFKITYSGKAWRVPYITNGNTFYVFPSRERDHAYDDAQADYIKKLSQQLKRQLTQAKRIAQKSGPIPKDKLLLLDRDNLLNRQ